MRTVVVSHPELPGWTRLGGVSKDYPYLLVSVVVLGSLLDSTDRGKGVLPVTTSPTSVFNVSETGFLVRPFLSDRGRGVGLGLYGTFEDEEMNFRV